MEKIIQLSTNNENDAFKVLETLKELDSSGEFNLSEYAVVEKSNDGKVTIKADNTKDLSATAIGGATGMLFGALLGPYGLLLGGSFGTLIGLTSDGIDAMQSDDILNQIAKDIPNGKVVVVAHAFEQWEAPLNTSIGDLAEISRLDVDEEINKAIESDLQKMDKEIEEAKLKVKESVNEAKEKAQTKLDELKDKRDERQKLWQKKMKLQRKAYKSWLAKTQEKIKNAFKSSTKN